MNKPANLPNLDTLSAAHCELVTEFIRQQIKTAGGQINFAKFMDSALYAPGLGYYSAGSRKFGPEGDFMTAPEVSPLFSQCIARQCMQVMAELADPVIIEFGAGSGVMALEILNYLASQDTLPDYYFIVEISADLKARQQELFQENIPQLLPRIKWLDKLPETPIEGIVLANEVLDAMPVHRFQLMDNHFKEYFVTLKNNQFQWHTDALSSTQLATALMPIKNKFLTENQIYNSEICLFHQPWIKSLSDIVAKGLVLLIDYGYPASEYYHPQRSQGTLMCHFRHHAHDNPFIYPGLQDITSHVNFTAIAEYASAAGFTIDGYINQGMFLINCGLTEILATISDERERFRTNSQIKTLTMPTEMGEAFKVMALSRKIEIPLVGFQQMDRRHYL